MAPCACPGSYSPTRSESWAPDHPAFLLTREHPALDRAGRRRRRRRGGGLDELLPDQERVLGTRPSGTLRTRDNLAFWTGQPGDATETRRLYPELLPDQERVLGPATIRHLTHPRQPSSGPGRPETAAGALRLFRELLPDLERVLGPDHPYTLATRNAIAYWLLAKKRGQ